MWRGTPYSDFAEQPWAEAEVTRLSELRLVARERPPTPGCGWACTPRPCPTWRRSPPSIRCARRAGGCWRSACTGAGGRATRSPRCAGPATRWPTSSAWTRARRCARWSPPSWASRPRPGAAAPPRAGAVRSAAAPAGRAAGRAGGPPRRCRRSSPSRSSAATPSSTPLLGAAPKALTGRFSLALVGGDAGAGKSTLVRQLGVRLGADGWLTASGGCPDSTATPPGWAWVEVLRSLVGRIGAGEYGPLLAPLLDDTAPGRRGRRGRRRASGCTARSAATSPPRPARPRC